MGGDSVSVLSSIIDDDDDDDISTTKPDFPDLFSETPTLWPGRSFRDHYRNLEIEANEKRISNVYAQLIKNYDDLKDRVGDMEMAKRKVLSYTPGSWIENVGGMTVSDYSVPKTTAILLIGPKGSGKSSLVNRISRVFEDDKFAPERAQVTYNSSIWGGTRFLQEYMIPRNSTSFCLYDTPGFSSVLLENLEMIRQWMSKGVRRGARVKSTFNSLWGRMECRTRRDERLTYERRRVNFVIFVVNGLSVLKCMENGGADTRYMHMVTAAFSSPFLSFKDHKPVIAITHGDLLSISERASVCVYLGNRLGVHPSKQIFDVPDDCDPRTEVTIVDLVRYALEHADRNLPCITRPMISKGSTILLLTPLLLLLVAVAFMFTAHLHGFHSLKLQPESVRVSSPEIKEVTEFDREIVPKPDLQIKKATEIDQEMAPEVIPGSIPKPSKKSKKVDAGKTPGKKQKTKKVRVPEPDLEIDWKSIRHLWYT